jgi:hypothetical protein
MNQSFAVESSHIDNSEKFIFGRAYWLLAFRWTGPPYKQNNLNQENQKGVHSVVYNSHLNLISVLHRFQRFRALYIYSLTHSVSTVALLSIFLRTMSLLAFCAG